MSSHKEYQLVLESRALYLFAHVTGPRDTLQISIAYWSEIAAECTRLNVQRLLVLEELEERSTATDMAEMIQLLPKMGFKDLRLAFVDPKEAIGMLAFAEVRAIEAGLTGHVFGAFAPAEKWLLSDAARARDGSAF